MADLKGTSGTKSAESGAVIGTSGTKNAERQKESAACFQTALSGLGWGV
jgi:hypothetical protein